MPAHSPKRKAMIPQARDRAIRSGEAGTDRRAFRGTPQALKSERAGKAPLGARSSNRKGASQPETEPPGGPSLAPEPSQSGLATSSEWQKLKVEARETFQSGDAHPVPFLLVTRRGLILHSNQAAADLLELKKALGEPRSLCEFVAESDQIGR